MVFETMFDSLFADEDDDSEDETVLSDICLEQETPSRSVVALGKPSTNDLDEVSLMLCNMESPSANKTTRGKENPAKPPRRNDLRKGGVGNGAGAGLSKQQRQPVVTGPTSRSTQGTEVPANHPSPKGDWGATAPLKPPPSLLQAGRVDLGTKVCKACKGGSADKFGHDVMCPTSRHCQPKKQRPARVDLGTKICQACEGSTSRIAHDVTCMRSKKYSVEDIDDGDFYDDSVDAGADDDATSCEEINGNNDGWYEGNGISKERAEKFLESPSGRCDDGSKCRACERKPCGTCGLCKFLEGRSLCALRCCRKNSRQTRDAYLLELKRMQLCRERHLEKGSKVYSRWPSNNKYYWGRITQILNNRITVSFDDGDEAVCADTETYTVFECLVDEEVARLQDGDETDFEYLVDKEVTRLPKDGKRKRTKTVLFQAVPANIDNATKRKRDKMDETGEDPPNTFIRPPPKKAPGKARAPAISCYCEGCLAECCNACSICMSRLSRTEKKSASCVYRICKDHNKTTQEKRLLEAWSILQKAEGQKGAVSGLIACGSKRNERPLFSTKEVGSRCLVESSTTNVSEWGTILSVSGLGDERTFAIQLEIHERVEGVSLKELTTEDDYAQLYKRDPREFSPDLDSASDTVERDDPLCMIYKLRCNKCALCRRPECGTCEACVRNRSTSHPCKQVCLLKMCLNLSIRKKSQRFPDLPQLSYYFGDGEEEGDSITSFSDIHPNLKGFRIVSKNGGPEDGWHRLLSVARYCVISKDTIEEKVWSFCEKQLGCSNYPLPHSKNALLGKWYYRKWTDAEGQTRDVYGHVTSCFVSLGSSKELSYKVEYKDQDRRLLCNDPEIVGRIPSIETVSEAAAWGGYVAYKEQVRERAPVQDVDEQIPFHWHFLVPDTRSIDSQGRLVLCIRGFILVLEAKMSSVSAGAGLGLWVTCTNRLDKSTNFVLRPGELLDLGVYGPLREQDRKPFHIQRAKNFIHEFRPQVFTFDAQGDEDHGVIDITDDKTGELHSHAEKNVLVRANETDGKETPTIFSSSDPQRNVHYFLGHSNGEDGDLCIQANKPVELKIDYGEEYEEIRTREGYPRVKGDALFAMHKSVAGCDEDAILDFFTFSAADVHETLDLLHQISGVLSPSSGIGSTTGAAPKSSDVASSPSASPSKGGVGSTPSASLSSGGFGYSPSVASPSTGSVGSSPGLSPPPAPTDTTENVLQRVLLVALALHGRAQTILKEFEGIDETQLLLICDNGFTAMGQTKKDTLNEAKKFVKALCKLLIGKEQLQPVLDSSSMRALLKLVVNGNEACRSVRLGDATTVDEFHQCLANAL